MRANVTCIRNILRLAHGNRHGAIGSRIGQDQFKLLNWTICLAQLLGMGIWPNKSSGRIILEKYKFQNIPLQNKHDFIIKYNYIYIIENI